MTTPRGVFEFLHFMTSRWEERARLNHRYFTDNLNFDSDEAWNRQSEEDVALILHSVPETETSGGRLLEIGCGPGRLLSRMAPRFRTLVGVDLAPTMLREARDACRVRDNVSLVLSKGYDLGFFRDRSFDFIVMFAVAIHVPREIVHSYIRESRRVLRPGGRFRFTLRREITDPGEQAQLEQFIEVQVKRIPEDAEPFTHGPDWLGHCFRDGEVEPFLDEFGFAGVAVQKCNPVTFMVEVRG